MKALLQSAAAASQKKLTEFLIEAGANAAEETLANRKIWGITRLTSQNSSPMS